MRILIVGLVKNPQFLRVKEEGEARGHSVIGCYASDLIIEVSEGDFSVRTLEEFGSSLPLGVTVEVSTVSAEEI